jgi:hypothetical protein
VIQFTSIVSVFEAEISVRAHTGFKTDAECLEYCRCLEVHEDTCVEFWSMELYSDVGDPAEGMPVRRYAFCGDDWTLVE